MFQTNMDSNELVEEKTENLRDNAPNLEIKTLDNTACREMETEKQASEPGGIFTCSICSQQEHYDYEGRKPPYAKHFSFKDDCYVVKDPFLPPKKGQFLIIGGNCSLCKNPVCKGQACSLFYYKNFCTNCAFSNIQHFPVEVQLKIRKAKT